MIQAEWHSVKVALVVLRRGMIRLGHDHPDATGLSFLPGLALKERGMLEDTLVIWGGEFGRPPMGVNRKTGD